LQGWKNYLLSDKIHKIGFAEAEYFFTR